MTHIVISDYPYHTVKNFFNNLEEAEAYEPRQDTLQSYLRLLNSRIYPLTSYRETEHGVNYGVDAANVIYK